MIDDITDRLIKAALEFWPVLKELRLDALTPTDRLWFELADYDSALPRLMKERATTLMAAIEDYKITHQ